MNWAERRTRIKTALIVGGVTALHAVFLGWALSSSISSDTVSISETIQVEFAELKPDIPPPVEPADLPEQRLESLPAREQPNEPANAPAPRDAVSTPAPALETSQASVLTQNAQSDGETDSAPDTASTGRLTEGQVAQIFKQLNCQKLRDHRHADCPETDPFTAAIMAEQRREVEPKAWADSDYINRPVTEQFFMREADARFHWPDADLFADPMPPGAYDAQRIRDGREPLWSKEMRDGFRKAD